MGVFSFKSFIKEPFFRTKSASNPIHVSILDRSFSDIFRSSGAVNDASIVKDFETIPDVFIVTDYIASQIAKIPIKLVKPNGDPSTNRELAALVKQPNPQQNWNELIKQFFAYYELLGNAYLYKIQADSMKEISSLYCLPADLTEILLLRDDKVPQWQNEIAGYNVKLSGKDNPLPAESVLHKKYINLRYDNGQWRYGISKYMPGNKITEDLKAIYDARVSIITEHGAFGVLSNDSGLLGDHVECKNIKERLNNKGVSSDQDKIIITTQKLSWQQMSMNLQELQLIENAKYDFEKICQLSGFDSVIFSTEGSTFANKEIATKNLVRQVTVPKVNDFYNDTNEWLSPHFGGDRIEPDWAKVEELAEDQEKLQIRLEKQIRVSMITPYRATELFYGEVDDKNAPPDEYFVQSNLKPLIEPDPPEPVEVIEPITEEDVKGLFKNKTDG